MILSAHKIISSQKIVCSFKSSEHPILPAHQMAHTPDADNVRTHARGAPALENKHKKKRQRKTPENNNTTRITRAMPYYSTGTKSDRRERQKDSHHRAPIALVVVCFSSGGWVTTRVKLAALAHTKQVSLFTYFS